MKQLEDSEIIAALRESKGYMAGAAARLGCSRATVSRRIDRVPEVRAAYEEIRESRLDRAESVLFAAVDAGKPWAVTYYLDAQGRARGYGKAPEGAPDAGPDGTRINFHALGLYFEGRAAELSPQDLADARQLVNRTAKAGTLSALLEARLLSGCEGAQKSPNARKADPRPPKEEPPRYPWESDGGEGGGEATP